MGCVREDILHFIEAGEVNGKKGISTGQIAEKLYMQRANVSAVLNDLYRDGLLIKIKGKPVLYTRNCIEKKNISSTQNANFDMLTGSDKSLKKCIQQAKAAILYPPHGLHTLILGPSGVGKTMFAELIYKYAIENSIFNLNSPFVAFNCSDYANNPQLLLTHLFGCKKGAFTGADKDREGIVCKANGGILFLDEVHRLPPEGQEMLFYLMDKGFYTPLGDDNKRRSQVLIICATTEDIDNVLLSTFTRRIPMNIRIPALSDRSLEERLDLICEFFKIEAMRIGRDISVSANTIRQLLLYDCVGNVGQLKSDIQLGCANAFLNSISSGLKNIEVHCTDFASHVNQGILIYKNYSNEVDKLIKKEKNLWFTSKGQKNRIKEGDYSLPNNFYEGIERRMQELHSRGIEESQIKMLMEFDIENYFKNFIGRFEQGVKKDEISKIVDENIITLVENFLNKSSKVLQKVFPTKVFYGLCLHISSSINRLKDNKKIINHNLTNIKEKYKEEFKLAESLSKHIEELYDILVPEDEIGFITMFLIVEIVERECIDDKPIIVIAMHGRHTASSMAEVVNRLVGANNVYAYDMYLDKKSNVAYEELKEIITKKHQGAGVMLLVDMGSLFIYGELISKDTGINIKAIDMVSTPIAIECSRKAVIEADINKIYKDIINSMQRYIPYNIKVSDNFIPSNNNIIITLCTTGEGSAIKLKSFIESKINLKKYNVQIFPMSLNNKQHMYNIINNLSKKKKILAIVGTINPNIYGIPFVSTYDIFMDKECSELKRIVNKAVSKDENPKEYKDFIDAIQSEIGNMDLSNFENLYKVFIKEVEENMCKKIEYDISIGLMVHMICAISSLIDGREMPSCCLKDSLINNYRFKYECISNSLIDIERFYNIKFSEDEICFILRNIISI